MIRWPLHKLVCWPSQTEIMGCVFCFSFDTDGSFLAIGSHDNCIYIYSVNDNGRKYSRVGKCSVSDCLTLLLANQSAFSGIVLSRCLKSLYLGSEICKRVNMLVTCLATILKTILGVQYRWSIFLNAFFFWIDKILLFLDQGRWHLLKAFKKNL